VDTKKDEKKRKSKDKYGKNTNRGYGGCSPASGCGPNFEIVLNIKQRKESEKKEEEEE
jgi:hypothetical protein